MTDLRIDHVVYAVDDLDAAAERFLERYGLGSVAGGRHPGHGTANRIVPLGPDYIELIAIVDPIESRRSPLGRRVSGRTGWIGHALRTTELDALVTGGDEILRMSRLRPDGLRLSWHVARFDTFLAGEGPFLIQWDVAEYLLPGAAPAGHLLDPVGIESIETETNPAGLAQVTVGLRDGSTLTI